MLIRKRAKSKTSSVPAKPKPDYDPRLGSGWHPSQDGRWMAPNSARDPLERIEDGDGRVLWRPKRRD